MNTIYLTDIAFAFAILLFFVLLRYLFGKIKTYIIKKIVSKTTNTIDDALLEALQSPIEFFIILAGLFFAKNSLTLSVVWDKLATNLINALFLFCIFWIVYNSIIPFSAILQSVTKKLNKELSQDITNFIIKSIKILVIIIGFISILEEFGYKIAGFLASLGLVGMAFALAAKDTVSNIFGSFVIFLDKPFRVGDWIKTPIVEGIIEDVGIRSTKVRTFAQALVTVPNGILANSAILNYSRMGKRRIKMNLGLTYSTTSTQMQDILSAIRKMLTEHQDIHKETIYIYFTSFNNSSLDIFCYFFTNTIKWGEFLSVQENVNLKIMQIVEQNKASFAFPSRSLYVEDNNAQMPMKSLEDIR